MLKCEGNVKAACDEVAYENGCDEGYGDVPLDYLAANEVDKADNECDCTGLTDSTAVCANEKLEDGRSACCSLCALVEVGEGSCACRDLGNSFTEEGEVEERSDSRAACYGCEGEKHKYASRDSGVNDVLTETAEEALNYYDSENGTESSLPELNVGGKVEREKKTGYGCGEIADRLLLLYAEVEDELSRYCADNAGEDEEKCLDAEENDCGAGA